MANALAAYILALLLAFGAAGACIGDAVYYAYSVQPNDE